MSVSDFSSAVKSAFDIMMSVDIFGIPLLVYFIIVAVFGLIVLFLKGTKK